MARSPRSTKRAWPLRTDSAAHRQSDPNAVATWRAPPVVYFSSICCIWMATTCARWRWSSAAACWNPSSRPRRAALFRGFSGRRRRDAAAARETGLEGLVAKRANSRYESRRSSEWIKIKIVHRQEFVICGFTDGERDTFGALVLGVYDNGKLSWAGNVGTGFTSKRCASPRQTRSAHQRRTRPLLHVQAAVARTSPG